MRGRGGAPSGPALERRAPLRPQLSTPRDRARFRGRGRQLSAAGAPWHAAVEATGWELMLHSARLGIAVVNDFCPAPRGMIPVPLEGVPAITYYAIRRSGLRSREAEELHRIVLETARDPRR